MSGVDGVRGALRELADEVRADPAFAAGAMARGSRIRLRRRVGGSVAAVVAVLAVATPYVLTRTGAPPAVGPGPAASRPEAYPRSTGPTTLPEANGVPGAGDRPDLVGTDPGVLHFDAALAVVPDLLMTNWEAKAGTETVGISYGTDRSILVSLGATEGGARIPGYDDPGSITPTTVNGRPATLMRYPTPDAEPPAPPPTPTPPAWRLRWQPVDGLWAELVARDWTEETFRLVAATLRLDRAMRCVQPLTAVLPAGGRWVSTYVGVRPRPAGDYPSLGVWWYSGFTVRRANGHDIDVRLEPIFPHDPASTKDEFVPNTTIAGRPAMWRPPQPGSNGMGQVQIRGFHGLFELWVSGDNRAGVEVFTAGLRFPGTDLADPGTWPVRVAG